MDGSARGIDNGRVPHPAPIRKSLILNMKSRRFSFPSMTAAQCPPCEAWRLGWMVSELWMTSAFNIAARTSWLGGMTPGADPAGAAALREWQRMWTEKLLAGWELGFEMQRAGVDLALGPLRPLAQRLADAASLPSAHHRQQPSPGAGTHGWRCRPLDLTIGPTR